MKHFSILIYILLAAMPAFCQIKFSGKLISEGDGTALEGATIRIKSNKQLTSTNSLGIFYLETSHTSLLLEISYMGYRSREISITLPLKEDLIISLSPSISELGEVTVSTGYQEIPRERATGSFEVIDKRLFNQQVSANVLDRLEAVANGLTVDRTTNASGRIMIRGLSTIRGPKEPLIVLDNFPYEGDLDNINPNDVENITILKDAAAASIWGTRAGNGVIVISTKKGRLNQPFAIDFNSNITSQDKPDLSYSPQMSSGDFIDVEKMLFEKGYYSSQINSSSRPVLSPVVELLIKRAGASSGEQAEIDARINSYRHLDVRNDFNRRVYSNGVNQQYSLGLRGGSNILAWNMSGGYDRNNDNLSAGYDRLNFRFQNSLNAFKGLTLSSALYYTLSGNTSGKPAYGKVNSKSGNLYPYAQFADEGGSSLPLAKDYRYSYIEGLGNGKLLDWRYFPLEDYQHTPSENNIADMLLSAGLNYTINKAFNLDFKYQFQRQQSNSRNLQDQDSYFARNLVNTYSQIDPSTGRLIYKVPPGGVLDVSNSLLKSHNFRGQLNFNESWGKHELHGLAGAEIRNTGSSSNSNRTYGYNSSNLTSANVDNTITYPSIVNGANSFIPSGDGFYGTTLRYVSAFANAAYTYNSKYTISASLRRDASNLFGVSTNERWTPLGSAGISWNVSDEAFYKLDILPYLKLRATLGYSGNSDPGMTGVTTIAYSNASPYTLTPLARFDNYANPEIRWETVRMMNTGADFHTKNQRLSGSLEYYTKKGSNLFGIYPLDYTAGIGPSVLRNVASMKGNGLDLDLTSINTKGRVGWTTNWNLSYYKDRVVDYYLETMRGSRFLQNDASITGLKGKPVYSIFSYRSAGLDPATGDPRGYENGTVSKNYTSLTGTGTLISDLEYHGSALPEFFGSIGNTFSFKNFSLTARMSFKAKYYFRSKSIEYGSLYASWNGHSDYAMRWQKAGDEAFTSIPSMVYPAVSNRDAFYKFSETLVERGDHVRFQYINLSYSMDKSFLSRLSLKEMSIYLNVNNVGILWRANKKGLDPEYISSAFNLPASRSVSIGLRANL